MPVSSKQRQVLMANLGLDLGNSNVDTLEHGAVRIKIEGTGVSKTTITSVLMTRISRFLIPERRTILQDLSH